MDLHLLFDNLTNPALLFFFLGILAALVVLMAIVLAIRDTRARLATLEAMSQTVQTALANQAYPFPKVVEALVQEPDPSRSPLFQTVFVWQQAIMAEAEATPFALGVTGGTLSLGDITASSYPLASSTTQYDITLMMGESQEAITAVWQY